MKDPKEEEKIELGEGEKPKEEEKHNHAHKKHGHGHGHGHGEEDSSEESEEGPMGHTIEETYTLKKEIEKFGTSLDVLIEKTASKIPIPKNLTVKKKISAI